MCRDGRCGHFTDENGRMLPDQAQAKRDHESRIAAEKQQQTDAASTTKFFNDRHDARVEAGRQSLYND